MVSKVLRLTFFIVPIAVLLVLHLILASLLVLFAIILHLPNVILFRFPFADHELQIMRFEMRRRIILVVSIITYLYCVLQFRPFNVDKDKLAL